MEGAVINTDENNMACRWDFIFNKLSYDSKEDYPYHMDIMGILTILFGMWIVCTVVTSKILANDNYANLLTYILACALHKAVPNLILVIPFMNSWNEDSHFMCNLFGFTETFFAVFEIESLTMICIERYVLAKYKYKEWKVPPSYYYLYVGLCVFFAFSYAVPPLVGIGQYAKDFDCFYCTFDITLPLICWKRYMVVLIFFMRSIKPVIMMVLMLNWAQDLEIKISKCHAQRNFTKGVQAALCSFIICGLPITMVRSSVILSQFIYGEVMILSNAFISSALFINRFSSAMVMIMFVLYDDRLRHFMIDLFIKNRLVPKEVRSESEKIIKDSKKLTLSQDTH